MEPRNKWYWGLIGISLILLLLEAYRVRMCMLDDCCEIHWLFINKEATCPTFPSFFY